MNFCRYLIKQIACKPNINMFTKATCKYHFWQNTFYFIGTMLCCCVVQKIGMSDIRKLKITVYFLNIYNLAKRYFRDIDVQYESLNEYFLQYYHKRIFLFVKKYHYGTRK